MKIEVNVNNLILIENNELNENEYNIHNIQFVFSNEYTNNLIKVALFTSDEKTYKIIIQDNQCNIPPEVLAKKGCFTLGVYAFEVENETLIERFSPTPIKLFIADGSYIADENTENSEPLTPTDKEQILSILEEMQEVYTEKIEEINTAIEETNNLNINVEKDGKVTTVTLTKKDGTTKTVEIDDGVSLQFMWQGTSLGIKREDQENYTFVNLQGATGLTPNIQIGTVVSGNTPSVTISGTPENPILNFTLVKGETGATGPTGPTGATGNGIASIIKTATVGLVDTYTITYTNGNTTTFTVTNGEDSNIPTSDYEALKQEVEDLMNNQLTDTPAIATSYHIVDSAKARFRKFLPEGHSEQDGEPSPENEVPIESAGDNGSITEKIYKEIFNQNEITTFMGYINSDVTRIRTSTTTKTLYFKINGGYNYTVSKTLGNRLRVGCSVDVPAINVSCLNIVNADDINKATIETPSNANYLVITYYNNSVDTSYTEQQILDSITIGSSEFSQTKTYYTQQPFRSIGDVRDVFFKNTPDSPYYDENLTENAWYERHLKWFRVTKDMIKGSGAYGVNSWVIGAPTLVKYIENAITCRCTHFRGVPYTARNTAGNNIAYSIPSGTNIEFRNTEFSTRELFEAFLDDNEVYIEYIPVEPTYLPCTSEQVQQLENRPSTYKTETNVLSEDEVEAYIDAEYVRDLETVINELQAQILA